MDHQGLGRETVPDAELESHRVGRLYCWGRSGATGGEWTVDPTSETELAEVRRILGGYPDHFFDFWSLVAGTRFLPISMIRPAALNVRLRATLSGTCWSGPRCPVM